MIAHAVACPHPPLLLPGVTGTPVAEVDALREACDEAIVGFAAAGVSTVVAVGAAPHTGRYPTTAPVGVHRFAPDSSAGLSTTAGLSTEEVLPLSLAIAVTLSAELDCAVELHGIGSTTSVPACREYGQALAKRPERVGLLVMADGSARRGPRAPGYLDERAIAVDDAVDTALRTGTPDDLLEVEPDAAEEYLIAGRASWQVLAGACEQRRIHPRCHYSADPFGVWYPVITWALD